ncbi:MAG: hypothetical protein E3J82_05880, partial [Candidatus Thorarchaeota archaeon]
MKKFLHGWRNGLWSLIASLMTIVLMQLFRLGVKMTAVKNVFLFLILFAFFYTYHLVWSAYQKRLHRKQIELGDQETSWNSQLSDLITTFWTVLDKDDGTSFYLSFYKEGIPDQRPLAEFLI